MEVISKDEFESAMHVLELVRVCSECEKEEYRFFCRNCTEYGQTVNTFKWIKKKIGDGNSE